MKFDFDLDEKRDGFESALMRLGRPYGGDVFGFHFPLLDGTEVAVAFEGGESLLHRADWRNPLNGNADAREYYRSGRLPVAGTKNFMNKPDEVLPLGDFGVENDYIGIRPRSRNLMDIEMGTVRPEDFRR